MDIFLQNKNDEEYFNISLHVLVIFLWREGNRQGKESLSDCIARGGHKHRKRITKKDEKAFKSPQSKERRRKQSEHHLTC
jgi:hypothetical protein